MTVKTLEELVEKLGEMVEGQGTVYNNSEEFFESLDISEEEQ